MDSSEGCADNNSLCPEDASDGETEARVFIGESGTDRDEDASSDGEKAFIGYLRFDEDHPNDLTLVIPPGVYCFDSETNELLFSANGSDRGDQDESSSQSSVIQNAFKLEKGVKSIDMPVSQEMKMIESVTIPQNIIKDDSVSIENQAEKSDEASTENAQNHEE